MAKYHVFLKVELGKSTLGDSRVHIQFGMVKLVSEFAFVVLSDCEPCMLALVLNKYVTCNACQYFWHILQVGCKLLFI